MLWYVGGLLRTGIGPDPGGPPAGHHGPVRKIKPMLLILANFVFIFMGIAGKLEKEKGANSFLSHFTTIQVGLLSTCMQNKQLVGLPRSVCRLQLFLASLNSIGFWHKEEGKERG